MFYLDIDINNVNYQKLINQDIDSSIVPRSISIDSVSSPLGTETNLTNYQVKDSRSIL